MKRTNQHPPRPTCRACHAGLAAMIASASIAIAGCSSAPAQDPSTRKIPDEVQYELDKQFVREPLVDQAKQAVLRERTLYDLHFEPNSARLTSVGRRDLAILAESLQTDGGMISVQRGTADAKLYQARISEVRARLVASGIRADRFAIDDGPAGGSGVSTAEALVVRKEMRKTPLPSETGQVLDPRAGTAGAGNKQMGGTPQ